MSADALLSDAAEKVLRCAQELPAIGSYLLMRRYRRMADALAAMRSELGYLEREAVDNEGAAAELAVFRRVYARVNQRSQVLYQAWLLRVPEACK